MVDALDARIDASGRSSSAADVVRGPRRQPRRRGAGPRPHRLSPRGTPRGGDERARNCSATRRRCGTSTGSRTTCTCSRARPRVITSRRASEPRPRSTTSATRSRWVPGRPGGSSVPGAEPVRDAVVVAPGRRVVGVTDYCVAPPHGFDHAARVRGTKNPDVAAIVDLDPDVVVANQEENRELDVERLRDAGLSVYVTRPAVVEQASGPWPPSARRSGSAAPGRGWPSRSDRALTRVSPPAHARCAPSCPSGATRGWPSGTDTFAATCWGCRVRCGARRAALPAGRPRRRRRDGRRTPSCCPTSRTRSPTRTGPTSPTGRPGCAGRRHGPDVVGAADAGVPWPTCAGWPGTAAPRPPLRPEGERPAAMRPSRAATGRRPSLDQ